MVAVVVVGVDGSDDDNDDDGGGGGGSSGDGKEGELRVLGWRGGEIAAVTTLCDTCA